jgi:CheY-like chemotaxis protein
VLVTDIGLPDGNGVELFQELKVQNGNGSIYGIALSGFGMDEDINRSLSAGFEHHITKPIEFAHLHRCLKEISSKLDGKAGLQEA